MNTRCDIHIGPSSWRNATIKEAKLSQQSVRNSDYHCEHGKSSDPIPHLRDTVAEKSNDEAHRYFRETRVIVCTLRESLLETNEEIKSLTRGKEALEKSLEHIRKDIKLNQDCGFIRNKRPSREKEHDGADDLLLAEQAQIKNLKKMLESQLKLVQQQLQVLDLSRKRLMNVLQERSRALDLICHSTFPSVGAVDMHGSACTNGINSAPAGSRDRFARSLNMSKQPAIADSLGSFTPEVDNALIEAREARERSLLLWREVHSVIEKTNKIQLAAHHSVNSGLLKKISETDGLKQYLQIAAGENRHSLHRSQRWFDATEKGWMYSRGPVTSNDLSTREKLDRPLIKLLQRHPGNNLPEAQMIVKGGDCLLESLSTTAQNIGTLKLAQLKLKDDIRDKSMAVDVDGSIVRMRRRKANHRWAMGQAF